MARPAWQRWMLAAGVLVVTHTEGFRHSSIPLAEATISELGQRSGLFATDFCRTADDVARMLNWIAQGHGFAGMHSASDTYHDAPAYLDMLGNEFLTHGDQATVEAIVENPSHPASSPLGQRFVVLDEIYRFARPSRGSVTNLLSLDRHPVDGRPDAGQPGDF